MKTEQIILTTSIKAAVDLSAKKNLFIGFTGALCAANEKALGVLAENVLLDEQAPVAVSGIAIVKSGATFSIGAALASNAAGKAIAATTFSAVNADGAVAVTSSAATPPITLAGSVLPQAINGYALDEATAADQLVRVKLV